MWFNVVFSVLNSVVGSAMDNRDQAILVMHKREAYIEIAAKT